jgi:Haloacid dehalogenase-like hydrolase
MSTPLTPDAAVTPDTAQALLFDCDGTLVDSVAAWEQAWTRALDDHGGHITPDWYRARAGLSPRDLIRAAETDHGIALDVDAVEARGVALYVESAVASAPTDPSSTPPGPTTAASRWRSSPAVPAPGWKPRYGRSERGTSSTTSSPSTTSTAASPPPTSICTR